MAGVRIGIPRYSFDPRKGDRFYIEGQLITIKRKDGDMLHLSRSVHGTTAMSVSNLYQVAEVPENSRFAPYEVRKAAGPTAQNPSWRKTVKRTKKARKAHGLTPWNFPSRQKQVWKHKKKAAKGNLIPAKIRVVNGGKNIQVLVSRAMARKLNPEGYRVVITAKAGKLLRGGVKQVISSKFATKQEAKDYAYAMQQDNVKSMKVVKTSK